MTVKRVFFLSLMTILFFSCAKNEDSELDSEISRITSLLKGTWTAVEVSYSGTEEIEKNSVTTSIDFTGEGQNIDFTLTFTESPNEVESIGTYDVEHQTFSVDGEPITLLIENECFKRVGSNKKGRWELEQFFELTILLKFATTDSIFLGSSGISELEEDLLVLTVPDTEEFFNTDGDLVTIETSTVYKFIK